MPNETFMDKAELYIGIYKDFLLPVLLCDSSLQAEWGNDQIHYHYRHLLDRGGLSKVLEEFDIIALREIIAQNGSCVLTEAIPLNGLRFYFTPLGGNIDDGYVVMLLGPGDIPPAEGAVYSGGTANALISSIRRSAEGIFEAMNAAHLKGVMQDDVRWLCPHLNRISVNTFRLLRIAGNVAEYARLQSGQLTLSRKTVDVVEWLEAISPEIKKLGEEANIPVTVNIQEDIPEEAALIYVDKKRLELAFYNVLNNCFEYTDPEGGSITVTLTWQDTESGHEIRIVAEDTGCGISSENFNRVFLPYVSIPKPGGDAGIGLGLPLASRLIEMQGGELTLQSKVGEGTTATITLLTNFYGQNVFFRQMDPEPVAADRFSQFNIGLAGTLHRWYNQRAEELTEDEGANT